MEDSKKRIVMITTKQPSSNPRLVKEAMTLNENGYEVTVVYNYWSSWADQADLLIFNNIKGINWIKAGSHPLFSRYIYWFTRLRFKFFKSLAAIFTRIHWAQVNAATQFFPELKKMAAGIKADLYIAHNVGALAAAAIAAKKNNAVYAFDAEDFHRRQDDEYSGEGKIAKLIEDIYFPGAAYITAGSPLIAAAYREIYPGVDFTAINNVFSKKLQPGLQTINRQPLKLFWFSQTVGLKRGVQDAISAMNCIDDFSVQLTILGDISESVKNSLTNLLRNRQHQIYFIPPCDEKQLVTIAAEHHIGLALEPGFSLNNKIALSNKLFIYLLAGNAVILSDTPAQELFYQNNSRVGWCYKTGDTNALAAILKEAANNEELLCSKRNTAWQLASNSLNWETEQQLFIKLVKSVV